MPTVPVPRVALVDGNGVVTGPGWYYLQQLITQQTSIANINEQVAVVLAQFAAVQVQFAAVQASVSALSASVSALQSSVSSLTSRMNAVEADIAALESTANDFLIASGAPAGPVDISEAMLLQ